MNHKDTKAQREERVSGARTEESQESGLDCDAGSESVIPFHGKATRHEPLPPEVNRVAHEIVDAAYKVHSALGVGLLESVYEACMVHELSKRQLRVERQVTLPIAYDGVTLDAGLRLDLVIEKCVVVELKVVEALVPVHTAQLLTYLKLSRIRLGLLINFNVPLIRDGIKRVVL
jgi:GxxExxY protein